MKGTKTKIYDTKYKNMGMYKGIENIKNKYSKSGIRLSLAPVYRRGLKDKLT